MANNTTLFSNRTITTSDERWAFLPGFMLAVLLTAILTNSVILYLFVRHGHLRTAFTVYLINLLGANLITQLIQVSIYLVANFRPYWWIGRPACSAYIYGFFIQAGMCNSHALISINRLWAVTHPISYRRLHTKRTAWIICGVMWLYVHVLTLPGFIADILYYRLPEEKIGCFLNKGPQLGWAFLNQFAVFNLPCLVMIVSYPVISYRVWKQRKLKKSIAPAVKSLSTRTSTVEPSHADTVSVALICLGGNVTGAGGAPGKEIPSGGEKRQRSHSFLVLTISTCGMLIFWLPSMIYYTAIMFPQPVDWGIFPVVATVLWFLECVCDPVLFTLALQNLRVEVVKLFSCG